VVTTLSDPKLVALLKSAGLPTELDRLHHIDLRPLLVWHAARRGTELQGMGSVKLKTAPRG